MTLELERVAVRHGARTVLDDVSFAVPSGTLCALVGRNGAGKSTLLDAIAAATPLTAGEVRWRGRLLATSGSRARARTVALLEQNPQPAGEITAEQVALLGRTPHRGWPAPPSRDDHRLARAALERVGAERLGGRAFRTLSGGERQRVLLARALAQDAELLLLDEPTAALDLEAQLDVLALVQDLVREGRTALVALHDLNAALLHADGVLVLRDGRVAASGAPRDTLTPGLIADVFGVAAFPASSPAGGYVFTRREWRRGE